MSAGAAAARIRTPPGATSRSRGISFDDGWQNLDDLPPFKTTVTVDATRKIITRNNSPDISFDRSINPYRGCEHGCIYCFARPTHAYLGPVAGPRFREQAVRQARTPPNCSSANCRRRGYVPRTIAIGTNTDPYQPIERSTGSCARILEVLERFGHPVGIVTKSALVMRDIDILSRDGERGLVKVALSVTTLDRQAGARDGAARRDAAAPARGAAAAVSGRRSDLGHGGAGHSRAQRQRDRAHPRCRRARPASRRRAMCCCACRSRCAICSANG